MFLPEIKIHKIKYFTFYEYQTQLGAQCFNKMNILWIATNVNFNSRNSIFSVKHIDVVSERGPCQQKALLMNGSRFILYTDLHVSNFFNYRFNLIGCLCHWLAWFSKLQDLHVNNLIDCLIN